MVFARKLLDLLRLSHQEWRSGRRFWRSASYCHGASSCDPQISPWIFPASILGLGRLLKLRFFGSLVRLSVCILPPVLEASCLSSPLADANFASPWNRLASSFKLSLEDLALFVTFVFLVKEFSDSPSHLMMLVFTFTSLDLLNVPTSNLSFIFGMVGVLITSLNSARWSAEEAAQWTCF